MSPSGSSDASETACSCGSFRHRAGWAFYLIYCADHKMTGHGLFFDLGRLVGLFLRRLFGHNDSSSFREWLAIGGFYFVYCTSRKRILQRISRCSPPTRFPLLQYALFYSRIKEFYQQAVFCSPGPLEGSQKPDEVAHVSTQARHECIISRNMINPPPDFIPPFPCHPFSVSFVTMPMFRCICAFSWIWRLFRCIVTRGTIRHYRHRFSRTVERRIHRISPGCAATAACGCQYEPAWAFLTGAISAAHCSAECFAGRVSTRGSISGR